MKSNKALKRLLKHFYTLYYKYNYQQRSAQSKKVKLSNKIQDKSINPELAYADNII